MTLPNLNHRTEPTAQTIAPYRIFFPLGILLGLVGVGLWPFYAMGWLETLPSQWHIDLQIQGFMFSFVLGFLLTALPRFTRSHSITKAELFFFLSFFILQNFATAFGFRNTGLIFFFVVFLGLITFSLRRFQSRASSIPDEFALVGLGLFSGLCASGIRVMGIFWPVSGELLLMARRMLTEGMMLMFVLGVGSKLGPMFFGFFEGPPIAQLSEKISTFSKRVWMFLSVGIGLFATFPIEYFVSEKIGLWMRAILATYVLWRFMKITKKPKTSGVLVRSLQVAVWAIALSPWGAVIHPQFRVDVLHVMFVAGFGILILTIATRVILSHGNHPMHVERTSMPLLLGSSLLVFAMLCRSFASIFVNDYFQLLAFAGALWIAGLTIWAVSLVRKAVVIHKD